MGIPAENHSRNYRLEWASIATGQYLSLLTPAERETYARLRFEKRRREWLAGRVAAKRLVREALREGEIFAAHEEIEIGNAPTGSPYARMGQKAVPISISHCGEWAAAAVAVPMGWTEKTDDRLNHPSPIRPTDHKPSWIGVDIEKIEPRHPSWLEIAFHPSENVSESGMECQTLLWTRKEAVLKFLGIGLSVDLRDVRFVPFNNSSGNGHSAAAGYPVSERRLELHGKALAAWQSSGSRDIRIESLLMCPGYSLSVAFDDSGKAKKTFEPKAFYSELSSPPNRTSQAGRPAFHGG